MNSSEELINSIKVKVAKIYDQKSKLAIDLENASAKISEQDTEIAELKEKIKELEDRNLKLKMANSLSGSADKNTATKLKINEMVREIDKCIALLNNK